MVVTAVAGYQNIVHNYLSGEKYLLAGLAVVVLLLMGVVLVNAFRRWRELLGRPGTTRDAYGEVVVEAVPE